MTAAASNSADAQRMLLLRMLLVLRRVRGCCCRHCWCLAQEAGGRGKDGSMLAVFFEVATLIFVAEWGDR